MRRAVIEAGGVGGRGGKSRGIWGLGRSSDGEVGGEDLSKHSRLRDCCG